MTLRRLTELPDFSVAAGQPDIRGWALHDPAGQKIGVIEDLWVDTEACHVVEAIVDLHGHDYALPIEALRLDVRHHVAAGPWSAEALQQQRELPSWHPHDRQVVRATFFPGLEDAPPIGELSAEDVLEIDHAADEAGKLEAPGEPMPRVTVLAVEEIFVGEAPPLEPFDEEDERM